MIGPYLLAYLQGVAVTSWIWAAYTEHWYSCYAAIAATIFLLVYDVCGKARKK